MIKKVFAVSLILAATASPSLADSYVHGYTRGNGTYVAPHYRSSPDSSYNNNWSTSPNVNPYTGQRGDNSQTGNAAPYDFTRPRFQTLWPNDSGYWSNSNN